LVLQRSEFYSFKHERDPEGMERELTLEQALYPDNWRASIMAWGLLMRSPGGEEAAQIVRPQLDSVYAREKDHEAVVAELLRWFDQTGQIDRAEALRSAAIARDPQGVVAMAVARSSVYQERDPAARLDRIQTVLSSFPWSDPEYDALVAAQVNAHARLGQYEEAVHAARTSRHPNGDLYNSIAWPLVEKGERLEDAVQWARTGVDLMRAQTVAEKPEYLSERSWRSSHDMRLGMVLDTYALGLFQLGRFQDAERAYEEADSLFNGEGAETAEHLAETYLKNNRPQDALRITRRMILTGTTSDKTLDLYREAYVAHHGTSDGMEQDLDELRTAAAERMRAELLKTRMATPAPAFALKSLDGTLVRLQDLRGKVVILDFWATWCGPCKMAFPYLQRFYEGHKENEAIALFAVNTWEREAGEKRQKTVRKFLADNQYTFPVLFDESAVEQYGVEGIPTRFVIDQEGVIRFKSIGFEGGEKMLTQMDLQLELLLGGAASSSR
jgi:thiol-disulfide isomerase/thioredoxin